MRAGGWGVSGRAHFAAVGDTHLEHLHELGAHARLEHPRLLRRDLLLAEVEHLLAQQPQNVHVVLAQLLRRLPAPQQRARESASGGRGARARGARTLQLSQMSLMNDGQLCGHSCLRICARAAWARRRRRRRRRGAHLHEHQVQLAHEHAGAAVGGGAGGLCGGRRAAVRRSDGRLRPRAAPHLDALVHHVVLDTLAIRVGHAPPPELHRVLQHLERNEARIRVAAALQHPVHARPRLQVVVELLQHALRRHVRRVAAVVEDGHHLLEHANIDGPGRVQNRVKHRHSRRLLRASAPPDDPIRRETPFPAAAAASAPLPSALAAQREFRALPRAFARFLTGSTRQ